MSSTIGDVPLPMLHWGTVMCVVVRVAATVEGPSAELDLDDLAVYLSPALTPDLALVMTRRLLSRVGAAQPEAGVSCWCGAPVTMPT
ncbi:hypothetical protein [Yinghuangia sp. YIM S09857]|uniref:hypothetical protein n=1 Tax=Yinghuangia sp. YIM S09857 TaxID=3436929 RepID=UPI003F53B61D